MLSIYRAAFPLAAMLLVPLAASAQQQPGSKDITVTAPADAAALTHWTNWVGRSITDNLVYPVFLGPTTPPTGTVEVAFSCSDSGHPSNVAVIRSSGSRRLDLAAVRAVQRVKPLHPLPDGLDHRQRYMARLMFLQSGGDMSDRITRMRRDADDANAKLWNRRSASAALVTLVPSAVGF